MYENLGISVALMREPLIQYEPYHLKLVEEDFGNSNKCITKEFVTVGPKKGWSLM